MLEKVLSYLSLLVNKMVSKEILCQFDLKIIVLGVSIVVSNFVTIFLYLKNKKFTVDTVLDDRLFRIQDISFNNPFLEDKMFIEGWDDFYKKYRNNEIKDYDNTKTMRYLQYEQYCEMIFNLISITYENTKCEKKVLEQVDYKAWARVHKNWWRNPLDEHSNHDTYSLKVCNMINIWVNMI